MYSAAKKTTALVATAAAVGFSSLFLAAAPASAVPVCSNGGTLLTSNVCELRVTAPGAAVFTPSADMSQLEVLLVAGGGSGDTTGQGYGAGGGGEVTVVGFGSDPAAPVTITVGGGSQPSTAEQGATLATAAPGLTPTSFSGNQSGNGNAGQLRGAGGGAGAAAVDLYTGGVGATGASVAPAGSLFATDTTCYGGGGAYGVIGTVGVATCGGGSLVDTGTDVTPVAAVPNTGGGGAGGGTSSDPTLRSGASGIVVLRWLAAVPDVTVTFASNGHGQPVAPQTFPEGGTATRPADPSEAGYTFGGWFTDAALTAPADFSAPVLASTTLYASWTAVVVPAPTPAPIPTPAPAPVVAPTPAAPTTAAAAAAPAPVEPRTGRQLPRTGGVVEPLAVPIGLGALLVGLGLVGFTARRTRTKV